MDVGNQMNLGSADSFILSQIGALEWGDYLETHSDAVLEAASHLAPTSPQQGCPTPFLCIDDSALEAAGVSVGPYPTVPASACPPPTFILSGCGQIGALERGGDLESRGDAALEAAGARAAQPLPTQYVSGCGAPTSILCHP